MANEFKVRKGLVVNGSGSVILDVQGSQGQLFSVTDQLSGSLFSVNDISGVPVLEAFSDSTVKIGQYLAEAIIVSGSTARITGSMSLAGFSTGSVLFAGTGGAISQNNSNFFWDAANSRLGIGTNAPDSTLSINGQVRFGNTTNGFFFSSNSISTFGNIFLGIQADRAFQITDSTFASTYFRVVRNTGAILIGTTVDDAINRLQVSGSSRFMGNMVITGSGNTSATNALTVQNSSSANMLRMLNDTTLKIGSQNIDIFPTANGSTVSNAGRGLVISTNASSQTDVGALKIVGAYSSALGTDYGLWISHIFTNGTSGVATHNGILLNQTINQTGGANGITRGLYVNPTLTAAADFRAIEWSNNAATAPSASWGLYGAGSAPNYLSGSLSIGTTAISSSVTVNGSMFLNSILFPAGGSIGLTHAVGFNTRITFENTGVNTNGIIYNVNNIGNPHKFQQGGTEVMRIAGSTGALLLGSTTDDTFNRLQVTGNARISQALTSSLALISGSGSQRLTVQGSGSSILTVDGALGRLFSVDDAASGSLFSVNTISGLPIMEAFSDNTVRIGQFGQRALFVSQSRVGIGKEDSLNATLDVSGSMALTGSFNHQGNYTTTGVITAQTLVISTISSSVVYSSGSNVFGNDLSNTQVLTGSVSITGSLNTVGNVIVTGSSTFNGNIVQTNIPNSITAGSLINFLSSNGQISAGANLGFGIGIAGSMTLSRTGNITATSGEVNWFYINPAISRAFAPTSGTATMNGILINLPIVQSGGANGITRGLYITPTLTSAWDYRSIEWTNNASATSGSWGLYGAGSAPNYLSGSLGIGTTALSAKLHVVGTGTTSATTTFISQNSASAVNGTIYDDGTWFFGGGNTRLAATAGQFDFNTPSGNIVKLGHWEIFLRPLQYLSRLELSNTIRLLGANVLINSTTDDTFNRLQISGSARISQALTASQALISGSGTQRLTVVGSGSAQPLFTVQGSQGELFSIVDSLSGSLFSVNDQSGLPIMEVFSDNTILMGNYLDPMLLTTTKTGSAAGINTIYTLPTSSYDAVYIDYTIRSGSNARAGNFMAMWSGTSVNFTDNSITEFGSTSTFTFGAHVSGANMIVTGSAPTAGWTIKTIIKAI